MICPNCGRESAGNYCSNCGAPLDEMQAEWVYEDAALTDGAFADRMHTDGAHTDEVHTDRAHTDRTLTDRALTDAEHINRQLYISRETEQRKNDRREPEKPPKNPARPRVSRKRAEGGDSRQKSHVKEQKKEQKKKDLRLKKLESEVERLRAYREAERERASSETKQECVTRETKQKRWTSEREQQYTAHEKKQRPAMGEAEPESETSSSRHTRSTLGEAAAKGVTGAVVLASRLMQLASALLMGTMTAVMAVSFWKHGQALGDIRVMVTERNYGLAVYVGLAGISLLMGLIWCLWIFTRKGAGGGVRMKTYDTGRGFLPFLFCLAVVFAVKFIMPQLPEADEALRGTLKGLRAAADAVLVHRERLLFLNSLGAVLSLVRKILRV